MNSIYSFFKNESYSKNTLKTQYQVFKKYFIERKKIKNIRFSGIPEDISENIIKYIIHKLGDTTSSWDCLGDLFSQKEGKQECKCFTSVGPISFSPKSDWDVIYFLDATDFLNDNFKLYKCGHKKSSNEWKKIKINKTETFEEQCKQNRRPRLGWSLLNTQIKYDLIFSGTFDEIIN